MHAFNYSQDITAVVQLSVISPWEIRGLYAAIGDGHSRMVVLNHIELRLRSYIKVSSSMCDNFVRAR